MAFEAPAHAERRFLMDNVHAIDSAMTFDAADALGDVGAVIEIGVVAQVMHLDPVDGLTGREAIEDGLEAGAVFMNYGVAIHTDLGGGDGGEGCAFDGAVAIAAIEAELPGVKGVTVGNGLSWGITDSGGLGREAESYGNRHVERTAEDGDGDCGKRIIRPAGENKSA